jgi:hypothetical protein
MISNENKIKSSADKIIERITAQLNNHEITQEKFDSIYAMVYRTPEGMELLNRRLRKAKGL